jgi:stage IV sporulation protein FB
VFKAYTLGRPFGVELKVHSSLVWLLGLFALMSLVASGPLAALELLGVAGILAASVTLHELGHIFAARLFGIGTTGITLYPIGGIARLTREARTSTEEVVVALAGPAVNVFLAGLAAIPFLLLGPVEPLLTVLQVNAVLALFNLVPAYPMDGGRVLRGVLWRWFGRYQATRVAARAGQGFAVVFGLIGLVSSPLLAVIAAFVFFQASGELRRIEQLRAHGLAEPPPPGVVRPQVLGRDGRPLGPRPWRTGPVRGGPAPPFGPRPTGSPEPQVQVVDLFELLRQQQRRAQGWR